MEFHSTSTLHEWLDDHRGDIISLFIEEGIEMRHVGRALRNVSRVVLQQQALLRRGLFVSEKRQRQKVPQEEVRKGKMFFHFERQCGGGESRLSLALDFRILLPS